MKLVSGSRACLICRRSHHQPQSVAVSIKAFLKYTHGWKKCLANHAVTVTGQCMITFFISFWNLRLVSQTCHTAFWVIVLILTGTVLLIRINFDTGPVKNCRNSITSPVQPESSCLVSGIMYCITGFISLNMKKSKLFQSYYIPTLTCLKNFSCHGRRIFQVTEICGFRKRVLWAASEN